MFIILSGGFIISDLIPGKMKMCETFASIFCDTSVLKFTDYRIKKQTFGFKMCDRCDLGILENARHIILQCPFFSQERANMFNELEDVSETCTSRISNQGHAIMHILLGKQPENITFDKMLHNSVANISGKNLQVTSTSVTTGRL